MYIPVKRFFEASINEIDLASESPSSVGNPKIGRYGCPTFWLEGSVRIRCWGFVKLKNGRKDRAPKDMVLSSHSGGLKVPRARGPKMIGRARCAESNGCNIVATTGMAIIFVIFGMNIYCYRDSPWESSVSSRFTWALNTS